MASFQLAQPHSECEPTIGTVGIVFLGHATHYHVHSYRNKIIGSCMDIHSDNINFRMRVKCPAHQSSPVIIDSVMNMCQLGNFKEHYVAKQLFYMKCKNLNLSTGSS